MIKIVTDSSVKLPQAIIEKYDITVVPLNILIDNVLYSDADLQEEGQFRQLMTSSKHLPKTSQPPVGLFAQIYEKLMEQGADEIIAIHLSASLSGTIEASRQGAQLSGAKVTIVDSQFTDQALGFQVSEAGRLADEGADKDTILASLQEIREKTELFIGLSNLENLIKGGRVNRVSGLIGTLFKVHVVMSFTDGHLIPIVKGRGNKTFQRWLDAFKEKLEQEKIKAIGISYSGNKRLADNLANDLERHLNMPVQMMETGAIIQTHTGEGAFAIMVHYD